MDQYRRDRATFFGVRGLLYNWIISAGSLTFIIFISMFVSKLWLPAVVLTLEILMMHRLRALRESDDAKCNILPMLMTRILLITAIIMVGINLYYMKFIDPQEYVVGTANRKIPYLTVLVVAPVTALVSIWGYVSRHKLGICKDCHIRFGLPSDRGFLHRIYIQESRFQLRMLIFMSIGMTIYTWTYYFVHYCNVNLNNADRFYYIWIPVILFVLSVIYVVNRYFNISLFYRQNVVGDAVMKGSSTLLRFIVVSGDAVFLEGVGQEDGDDKIDTPVSIKVPYRERMGMYDAHMHFASFTGLRDGLDMRFLYENSNDDTECNIFHYLCLARSQNEVNASRLKGKWYTQSQLESMLNRGMLSPLLMSEIHRVYTVAMAWKTYDREGRRLYEIKHYKPTFRLHDLSAIDVDFNDPTWLFVAEDNEDRPFFHLRKFWRKYVSGEN